MKTNKRLSVAAVAAAVIALSFVASAALTESGLRTALVNWLKGDRTVMNPWTEVVDFVATHSVLTVGTFADLATVPATGRSEGARVRTRGYTTAGDGGAADYTYSSTSAAATNTYSVIAATGGGRYIATTPITLRFTFPWDPGSLASNQTTFTNVTCTGAAAGDVVLVSHPLIGNQGASHLTGKATTDLVYVSFYNNSAAAIDIGVSTGKIMVLKY
jgi:hypothetical protein